jgi:hypothetical protein
MPPSTNNQAYAYAREYMDRALMSEKGIRISFETVTMALRARWDCYNARKVDKKNNKEVLGEDSSQYDSLRFAVGKDEKGHFLKIEPQTAVPLGQLDVEDL